MKTIQKTIGWLVMAAALTIGTTACSSDDMLAENNEPAVMPQAQQKVHITVGAGIDISGKTRSAVDYDSETKERTLKFTDGDKLYVRAVIEDAYDDNLWGGDYYDSKIMAGFLTIDPATISADGKSARFTGDLDIYVGTVEPEYGDVWVVDVEEHWEGDDLIEEQGHYENGIANYNLVYSDGTHTFEMFDPLDECDYANAKLIHAGSEAKYTVDDEKYLSYDLCVASSVNELMTSSLRVGGGYYSNSFHLSANSWYSPILNCTVSGLTPDASYTVRLKYDYTEDYAEYDSYKDKVAADGDGKATFAITVPGDGYYNYQLELSNNSERKIVTLGWKELETKVYNVTATATDYIFPDGEPIVYGTEARPEDAWNGKVFEIYEDPADVTISGNFTGYCFDINYGGTVSLNNVTASYDGCIIYNRSDEHDLTLVLTGDNSLSSKNTDFALSSNKDIKLMCDGSSATLTVTARLGDLYGFNSPNAPADDDDTNVLAAEGYTVKLTSKVAGPDEDDDEEPDYYTWTFTVTKK